MRIVEKSRALVVLMSALALLIGCSDSGSSGGVGSGNSDTGGLPGFDFDTGEPDVDVVNTDPDSSDKPDITEEPDAAEEPDVPGAPDVAPIVGELQFVNEVGDDGESCVGVAECAIEMVFNSDRTVAVRYVLEGEPVKNALIRFSLAGEGAEDALSVSPNAAYSDDSGEASTLITVENNLPGEFEVIARVDDDPNVAPIRFMVAITSKLGPPLIVRFKKEYPGTVTFATIQTTIFKKTPEKPYACDTIELLAKLPAGGTGLPPVTKVTDSIEVPALAGLEQEGQQSYTVVALGKSETGAIRVMGCNDTEGEVKVGSSAVVVVSLFQAPPDYTGCYDVTTNLDVSSALPPQIKAIFDIIFALFESPAGGLAMLACALGDQVSVLEDLCGYVFDDPANPQLGEWSSTWADVIIQVVDGLIISLIESEPLAEDIFYTGKDVSQILTALELRSQIQMKPLPGSGLTLSIPDDQGFFKPSQCSQTWSEVRFKWTLNAACDPSDPSCGWIALNFNEFSNAAIATSKFEARVDPTFYDMNVFPHAVNFQYGKFLNAIVKAYLLPEIFGDGSDGFPKIDTYEEALKTFMCGKEGLMPGQDCCNIFATEITNGGGGFIADTIELACNALVPLGASFVEDQLMDLDLGGDNLMVETAETCKLEDNNGDGVIDNWGRKTDPCLWKVSLGLFGLDLDFDATFYAVRATCN